MEAAALKWLDLFNKGKIVVEVDTSQLSDAVEKVGGLGRQATTGLIVVGQLIGTATRDDHPAPAGAQPVHQLRLPGDDRLRRSRWS